MFKLLAYRLVIFLAVKRAKRVITVSDFTKKDILKNFKINPGKIEVIKEGCEFTEKENRKTPETIFKKYDIVKPYLLYVGNAYPHKNLDRLCLAFKEIQKRKKSLNLVLVGGKDFFYEKLESFIQKKKIDGIHLPGFIPDEHLGAFYREAECYVFPSLYEGFGLPPLEALSHNCPVISSNKSSMPEILGKGALYFDPEDVDSIKKAIQEVLSNPEKKKKTLEEGRKRLPLFDWKQNARETLQVYKKVLQ